MSDNSHLPGLQFAPGDGVLARAGSLIVLSSVTENEFLDKLLAQVANVADDGADLARLAEKAIENDDAWRQGLSDATGPALVAIGPGHAGLTATVSGPAWAEITTCHGVQRLEGGQPSMLLQCVLGSQVIAVHGGLDADRGRAGTDRFSRLDGGTVRAGGFTYYPGQAAAVARAAASPSSRGEPSLAGPSGPAGPAAGTPAAGGEPGPVPATPEPAVAEGEPDRAGEPFDAVLLVGDQPDAVQARPALPLGPAGTGGQTGAEAPIITGVYCKNGHFDDPQARFCAVCGISMNQLTSVPRPGHRPPLGVLVSDDGAVFRLDSDYVIGRDPTLEGSVATGKARPLRITDDAGTVSRVHARIQLDGWLIMVTDLGSTNGTRVCLPGQAADQALAPRVPTAIPPGSRIELGGRQFRYESHRGR